MKKLKMLVHFLKELDDGSEQSIDSYSWKIHDKR